METTVYEVITGLPDIYARFMTVSPKGKYHYHGNADSLIFDLKNWSAYSGDYYIIKNGKVRKKELMLSNGECISLNGLPLVNSTDDPYAKIEQLYANYYMSVPSAKESGRKRNFLCKNVDKMTLEEIESGEPRAKARYALEAFILLAAMSGIIPWYDLLKFYWYSNNCKGLIVYRDWIIHTEEH